jgi:hypothetical protein
MRQRTQCNENPDFVICEIASESGPSDPEMIRTVDVTPYQSFGDREFKMKRTQYNKNLDFAMCDITIQSWPLKQVHIWTVGSTPCRSFMDRDLESRDASSPDSRNAKSRKRLMHKAVVTALGHISERWTDVRGQGGAESCRTVRWRTIQKVTRQEWGPSSILHHSGPPPPVLKTERQGGSGIA